MSPIQKMARCVVDVGILKQAIDKFDNCKHSVQFTGQMSCQLYHHYFDNEMDLLHHCGTCIFNKSNPNDQPKEKRFP